MKYQKLFIIAFLLIFCSAPIFTQNADRPKLVVGIVIDQMRYDYLYQYYQFYGNDGFKRLMNEGSNFTFAHLNYEPTSTGPGHASIYTGTTPFYHGIIGDGFYDRFSRKMVNCVTDSTVNSVGSNDEMGQASPTKLLSTTITDQLKLATNGRSKVISIGLKDRSSVIPGGHWSDGTYWYNTKTGDFITSTYYVSTLPKWVEDFNKKKLADLYLSKIWELTLPTSDYQINPPDESSYEKDLFNEGKTSFPHTFQNLNGADRYEYLRDTPFGNNLQYDFVKAALENENLGKRNETDFLAISFSATDLIGHAYGTFAYETMDAYIKLDKKLADLLALLDKQVGKGNYLLFLTADHAAIETPAYLFEKKMPTGGLNTKLFYDSLYSFVSDKYGTKDIIENISNKQIFLNRDVIKKNNLDIHIVRQEIADYLRDNFSVITSIFTRDYLETKVSSRSEQNLLLNGFNPSLSGDIAYDLRPGYLPNFMTKGTTHGTTYNYDTHVPLIFFGWHIPAQTVNSLVYTIDIAPTIANLIKIEEPNASIGIPLIK
jgi:predicted AlkP superfamily pyrophosphatase or phosphodiesterase